MPRSMSIAGSGRGEGESVIGTYYYSLGLSN